MLIEKLKALLAEAEELNKTGKHGDAEHRANEVLAELDSIDKSIEKEAVTELDTLRCSALIELSTSQWRRGDNEMALANGLSYIDLVDKLTNRELKAKALGNIGSVYMNLSDYPQALSYYQKAVSINEALGYKDGIVSNFTNIGLVYSDLSDYPQALSYYQKALAISEEIGNKFILAINLGNIGVVYRYLSDYPQALTYFQKALAIHEETGHKNGTAVNLGNIGIVYGSLSDYAQELTYYQKALAIFEEIGNKGSIAVSLGNIGNVYMNLKDYPHALSYHQKALSINEEIGSKAGIASNLRNLGNMFQSLSDYPQALIYYQKACAIYEEIGDKAGNAVILGHLGVLYATKELNEYNADTSEEYLHRSMAVFEEIGNKRNLYEIHQGLAALYETQERWKEALELFKKYHILKEEVQSEEATKQSQLMENRRKAEEAERDRQVKLARFQEQEKILLNILPAQIAERILEGEKRIADLHENVSVFFSDIVGFTQLSQRISPDELLSMLNEIFSEFDRIARKHGLEKIKTIGDAYMAVAGVPLDQEDHAERAAAFALEVIEYMKEYRKTTSSDLQIRVGLHCGRAIAGVIGENKFAYDLWGDSVNTASRMESHGEPGKIHVSDDFRNALSESSFNFIERGEMEIKGKGMMKTYFIEVEK